MAYAKSDEVKQSVDSLEKYRLFTDVKFKLFIWKEFDQRGTLLRKNMLEGDIYQLITQLPLTAEETNNRLIVYSGSFSPV